MENKAEKDIDNKIKDISMHTRAYLQIKILDHKF